MIPVVIRSSRTTGGEIWQNFSHNYRARPDSVPGNLGFEDSGRRSRFRKTSNPWRLLMLKSLESRVFPLVSSFPKPHCTNFQSIEIPRRTSFRISAISLAILILGFAVKPIASHAVLMESLPAAKSSHMGPDITIRLRFNVRIDANRSILTLIRADGSSQKLQASKSPEPNLLTAIATGLPAGDYRIHWQVLAPNGHITSGEIPFSVSGR
jgi:methionine-rich copper-binding protein CopC